MEIFVRYGDFLIFFVFYDKLYLIYIKCKKIEKYYNCILWSLDNRGKKGKENNYLLI